MKNKMGFVAIVGRPNVGKSTLLNQLIGEKISITSEKAQTTRQRILGIKTCERAQAVFIDTPGIHLVSKHKVNRTMNRESYNALKEIDLVIFVIDGLTWTEEDDLVLKAVLNNTCPVFLVLNKIDKIKNKTQLLPVINKISSKIDFAKIIPISAKSGEQLDILEQEIFNFLPDGEHYYAANQTTEQALQFRLSEIIREKIMRNLGDELPYALTVEIEKIEKKENKKNHTKNHTEIRAIIWVERDSQKGIVIGKQGAKLKEIGIQARLDMEKIIDNKINLRLWIKVKNGRPITECFNSAYQSV